MSARTEYNTEEFIGTKTIHTDFFNQEKKIFHFGPAAVKEEKNSIRLVQKKKLKHFFLLSLFVCQRIFSPGSNNNKTTSSQVSNIKKYCLRLRETQVNGQKNSKTFRSTRE